MEYKSFHLIRNFIFIIILNIIIKEAYLYISFHFPNSLFLSNGNIFIIHKYGISICNSNLTEIIYNITFENDDIITVENLAKITSVFENGYIFNIINDKIYIFDEIGIKLYKSESKIISNEENPNYYSLIPIKIYNGYYYYIIGFNDNNSLNFLYYKYDIENKQNIQIYSLKNFTKDLFIRNSYYIEGKSLTCQFMKNITKDDELLTCFFLIHKFSDNIHKYVLAVNYFDIFDDKIIDRSYLFYNVGNNITYIKSAINNNHTEALVSYIYEEGKALFFYFRLDIGYNLGSKVDNFFCSTDYYGMKINYFKELEKYSFSCIGNEANIILIFFFNKDSKSIKRYLKYFKDCKSIYGFSVLYSNNTDKCYLISDPKINNKIEFPFLLLQNENEELEINKEENEDENTNENDILECKELEKCQKCNNESLLKDLCIKCNNKNGYYLFKNSLSNVNHNYIDCINNETKPHNFYFNKEKKYYEECYESCNTCEYGGNRDENNCTSCENNYIFEPEKNSTTNCVLKCPYFYYYKSYGRYKCSPFPICPEEKKLLISEKKKCVDNCKDDNLYKYQYNGICLKECPNNTKVEEYNEFNQCKDIQLNQCILSENELFIYENITENEINYLVRNYANEFNYTINHLSKFINNIYSIIIYRNSDCISKLSLEEPEINFSECYKKVANKYQIDDKLIIVLITKRNGDKSYRKMISYLMFEPSSGKELLNEDICKDDNLIIKENLFAKINDSNSNIDINSLLYLSYQDINFFNLSNSFYTDICIHFDYPIDKDISLKDRIKLYYPNISLCEDYCLIKGVNISEFKAICECKFNNILKNNFITNNIVFQKQYEEIYEFISQTNIQIIKCYKDIFYLKYYKSNLGGLIVLILIIFEILITYFYCFRSLFFIRKYIFGLSGAYILYLSNKKNQISNDNLISSPPKKIKKKRNNFNRKPKITNSISDENNNKKNLSPNTTKNAFQEKLSSYNMNSQEENSIKKISSNFNLKENEKTNKCKSRKKGNNIYFQNSFSNNINIFVDSKNFYNDNIEDYMNTDIDEMDYDNAIKKDERKFCEYFCDKLKKNQIIINSFFVNDPLRPKTIKLLLLVLDITLYLFVNALFFNEDYISEVFNSNKKEKFFTFIPRSYNRFLYTTLVGVIVNYIIDCFFIEEKKIKGVFKREKENVNKLKIEISKIIKNIKKRYILFIILTFVSSFFILYYIFCFNNIYPHMRKEWIKSSIIIIIIMQIIYGLESILETVLRFISFKLKSERIYKISLMLS